MKCHTFWRCPIEMHVWDFRCPPAWKARTPNSWIIMSMLLSGIWLIIWCWCESEEIAVIPHMELRKRSLQHVYWFSNVKRTISVVVDFQWRGKAIPGFQWLGEMVSVYWSVTFTCQHFCCYWVRHWEWGMCESPNTMNASQLCIAKWDLQCNTGL